MVRPTSVLLVATLTLAVVTRVSGAQAQSTELTRADRLAVLYTPQLRFAPDGQPLITVQITDGEDEIHFTSDSRFSILPLGSDGPEIEVPAETRVTVSIREGQSGEYVHHAVLAEFGPGERERVPDVLAEWAARGFEVQRAEVGAVFAVAGERFDTRRTLLVSGAFPSRDDAERHAGEIEERFGVPALLHSDLNTYPGGTLIVSGLPGGVTIRHQDILTVRGDPDTRFTVEDVEFDRGTRSEGEEDRTYVGTLLFTADHDGELVLVNELPAERLVAGILPAELYPDAPREALMAQAVAARSMLLTDLGARHLAEPFMTCSDQRCQVYRGVGFEDSRTTDAVERTRGRVLTSGDRIITAYFSSNNGGFAGSNASTWGETQLPYLVARYDGLDANPSWSDGLTGDEVRAFIVEPPPAYSNITSFGSGRSFRWTAEMTGPELSEAVARREDVGPVTELEVLGRDESGRVTRLRIEGTRGEFTVERELGVRRALGGLKSALFVMDVETAADGIIERVRFSGAGFGHGVGLCQTGAIGAAEAGLAHDEILARYYPGTTVRSLY